MKRRKEVARLIFCFSFACCASALGQSASPSTALLPNYDPIKMQAGTWDAAITFFDDAGKPSGTAKGGQTNVLLMNGHWVTNDLMVAGTPPFQGHGVWGWDPVAKQYVDTWVDIHDGTVRMTEKYDGNHRTLNFYGVALQSGRVYKQAEMVFTKRSDTKGN